MFIERGGACAMAQWHYGQSKPVLTDKQKVIKAAPTQKVATVKKLQALSKICSHYHASKSFIPNLLTQFTLFILCQNDIPLSQTK